jgi:NAD-dependent SIR2 family protein deacetylase
VEEPPVSKNIKTVELVECPKCNKKLTERTLKYSHEAVCPANEAKTIKKPKREQAAPKQVQYEETLDEHIERPAIQKIKRIQVRSERYKNLITHAF